MSDEFLQTLPEEVRAEEVLKDVDDVGALATKFIEASKKELDWRSEVPEDLKETACIKEAKGIGDLCKAFVNAEGMIGDSIRLPEEGDEKAQEKLDAIYTKLGRPAEAKDYTAQMPGDEDGPSWDKDSVDSFKGAAHTMGLSNKQAQGMMDWYGNLVELGLKAQTEALKDSVEGLKTDWGSNHDRNMAFVFQLLEKVGSPELRAELDATALGNSPHLTKLLYRFAKDAAEDGIIPGEVAGVIGKEDAKAKIAEINANKEHPYFKEVGAPGQKEASEEMYRLNQIAHGSEPVEAPVSVSA